MTEPTLDEALDPGDEGGHEPTGTEVDGPDDRVNAVGDTDDQADDEPPAAAEA